MNEIAKVEEAAPLVDVLSGELLPATPENAHRVLAVARDLKGRIQDVIGGATAYLLEESRRQGTKTFHTASGDVVLNGGPSVDYEPEVLEELLREAGLPEGRIREVVREEVVTTWKVDRGVLRQLVASNPDYAVAAEKAKREVSRPWRANLK